MINNTIVLSILEVYYQSISKWNGLHRQAGYAAESMTLGLVRATGSKIVFLR